MNAYSLRAQIDTALTYPRSPGEIVRVMPLNGAGGKVDWQRTGPTWDYVLRSERGQPRRYDRRSRPGKVSA